MKTSPLKRSFVFKIEAGEMDMNMESWLPYSCSQTPPPHTPTHTHHTIKYKLKLVKSKSLDLPCI